MTPHSSPDPAFADRIDAFIDGTMPAPERAAFEKEVAANSSLREEISLQRRIDSRLRDLCAPPAAPAIPTDHAKPAVAGRIGVPAWLAMAAALAVVAAGVWLAVGGNSKPAPADLSADAMLAHLVKDESFKPIWVCKDDQQFLEYTKNKLGVEFLAHPDPGVQLVGWTYQNGLLKNSTQILLVRAEGKELFVAMGPKRDDRTMHTDPGSPLHVTRKTLKSVVMYEISPLDHPVVVNTIKEP